MVTVNILPQKTEVLLMLSPHQMMGGVVPFVSGHYTPLSYSVHPRPSNRYKAGRGRGQTIDGKFCSSRKKEITQPLEDLRRKDIVVL